MPVRNTTATAATTRPSATTSTTATTATTTSSAALSSAALAKARAQPLLDEILGDIAVLTPTMMPHEPESKALRKKIARLRDVLDVFVHSWGGAKESSWQKLRSAVDTGYETIGHFKDLFDSQNLVIKGSDPKNPAAGVAAADVKYDPGILKKRRDEVLAWKRAFLEPASLASAKSLIANPAATPQTVKPEHLTRFFWGAVDIEPDAALSGIQNVKRLAGELVDEAGAGLAKLVNAPSVRGEANETAFHDVRKRLRSIANLAASFPEIVDDAAKGAPLLKAVTTFVSRFGDVEDALVGLHIAMEERDVQAIPGHQQEIDAAWVALKKTIVDEKLAVTLTGLRKLV